MGEGVQSPSGWDIHLAQRIGHSLSTLVHGICNMSYVLHPRCTAPDVLSYRTSLQDTRRHEGAERLLLPLVAKPPSSAASAEPLHPAVSKMSSQERSAVQVCARGRRWGGEGGGEEGVHVRYLASI